MWRLPRYVPLMIAECRRSGIQGPGAYEITIYHDDWCDLLSKRGPCNCNPEIGPIKRVE